jgi:hypothetical protein
MAADVFLGLIALGVIVMATIQVAAIVFAVRAARRVESVLGQLRQDIRPIVSSIEAMSADIARTTAKAAAQVDRLEELVGQVSKRLDSAAAAVHNAAVAPIRHVMAVVHGIKAAFASMRGATGEGRKRPPPGVEEEDSLFIG